jgi:hypothetical protein
MQKIFNTTTHLENPHLKENMVPWLFFDLHILDAGTICKLVDGHCSRPDRPGRAGIGNEFENLASWQQTLPTQVGLILINIYD